MNEVSSILTYLKAAGLVAAATALAAAIVALTPLESVSAIYMLPVLAAAIRYGTGPAVAAAGLGTLMTTLFYPPIFSVLVVRPPQLIDLGISLIVALTMGRLAGKVRADMLRARDEERRVRQLYGLSSDIAGASGVEAIYAIVAAHIADALARPVALFVGADRSNVRAVHSPFTHDVTLALQRRSRPSQVEVRRHRAQRPMSPASRIKATGSSAISAIPSISRRPWPSLWKGTRTPRRRSLPRRARSSPKVPNRSTGWDCPGRSKNAGYASARMHCGIF